MKDILSNISSHLYYQMSALHISVNPNHYCVRCGMVYGNE